MRIEDRQTGDRHDARLLPNPARTLNSDLSALMLLLRLPLALFSLAWQSAFLALGQIWANKVRAILTTIGIVIGVGVGDGGHRGADGAEDRTCWRSSRASGPTRSSSCPSSARAAAGRVRWSEIRFDPELFDGMLEHCPSVKAVTRLTGDERTISYGTNAEPMIEVQGIDPAWHEIENRNVVVGRRFTHIDNEQGRPAA